MLRTELHCHNVYSNGHVGDLEPPFDSNVTINEQLQKSLESKLDILFVTNHNTLDGFKQITEYKNNHEKFSNLEIYPAVEITTDKQAHVLVYGLHDEIKSNQSIDEILDAAKSQDAVTIAPHPFSLVDSIRDDSLKCDLFEVFNSSNVDIYSNKKAEIFAKENNLLTTVGSDSHISSTIGRCTNMIDAQNNLDDVIYAMKKGKISIEKTEYITHSEVLEHIQYKIENSKEYIDQYVNEFYPKYSWLFNLMYRSYMFTKKSLIWDATLKIALFGLRRISYKINFEGYDPCVFKTRDIPTITKMIF